MPKKRPNPKFEAEEPEAKMQKLECIEKDRKMQKPPASGPGEVHYMPWTYTETVFQEIV